GGRARGGAPDADRVRRRQRGGVGWHAGQRIAGRPRRLLLLDRRAGPWPRRARSRPDDPALVAMRWPVNTLGELKDLAGPRRGRTLAACGLLALSALATATPVRAGDVLDPEPGIQQSLPARAPAAPAPFRTANSNCVGSQCDTVWVGHLSSGPGGPFMGVGVGGVWDFDTDVAGTDSSQGWQRYAYPITSGGALPALSRTWWGYDYGNMIN